MINHIYLLTGNQGKIDAANLVFNKYDIEVLPLELNIPEIQASSSREIARAMAREAYNRTGKPVIREDHSFFIDELGFPGPFMAYADKAISAEQLLKIVDTLESRDAHFELAATYIDGDGRIHDFSCTVPITIGRQIRGNSDLNWERLMMLKGSDKTFAESGQAERVEIWTKNFEAIARVIRRTQ